MELPILKTQKNLRPLRIIATRNPVLCRDREVYYHAFRKIVLDVKKKLGNPYVTISMLNTNYFYFDSI